MKNKILIIILIIFGSVLAVLAGIYFTKQNRTPLDSSNQTNIEQSQNKIITDDFFINLPVGWKQTAPAIGTSVMAIDTNEIVADPAAQKINFKSYFAVSYDTLQGKKLDDYLQTVKNGLSQTISNVVFTNEQDLLINDRPAHAMEAELTQQGVNFKILLIVITGQEEDVWVMSFNTTKNGWNGYKETFYDIADSFSLKK